MKVKKRIGRIVLLVVVVGMMLSQMVYGEGETWDPEEIEIPITLGVTLRDAEDGDDSIKGEGRKYLMVSVAGVNMEEGMEYLIEVHLVDAATMEPIRYEGKEIGDSRLIIPKGIAEVSEFRLAFDGKEQRGRHLAAIVKVYQNDEEVASCLSTKFQGGSIMVQSADRIDDMGDDPKVERLELEEAMDETVSGIPEEVEGLIEPLGATQNHHPEKDKTKARAILGGVFVVGCMSMVVMARKLQNS